MLSWLLFLFFRQPMERCDWSVSLAISQRYVYCAITHLLQQSALELMDQNSIIKLALEKIAWEFQHYKRWIKFNISGLTLNTRSSAMAEGPRYALVSIERNLQSTNDLEIHSRSSQLLLLNGHTAYQFLFVHCCFNIFI